MQLCYVWYNNKCSDEVTPVTSLHHFHRLCTQYHLQTAGGGERRGREEREEGKSKGRRKKREREREGERRERKRVNLCVLKVFC